jgi:hypothetical protein
MVANIQLRSLFRRGLDFSFACDYVAKLGVPLAPPHEKSTFVTKKNNGKDDVFASFSGGKQPSLLISCMYLVIGYLVTI